MLDVRVIANRHGQQDEVVVANSSDVLWIDQSRFENHGVLNGLGQLGRAILPVRLERGEGAVQVLGVRRASERLAVDPTLVRIETPQSVSDDSLARVQAALEARGVKFLVPEGDHGPGMRIPENTLELPAVRGHERRQTYPGK